LKYKIVESPWLICLASPQIVPVDQKYANHWLVIEDNCSFSSHSQFKVSSDTHINHKHHNEFKMAPNLKLSILISNITNAVSV
jgi:hypothetical protein